MTLSDQELIFNNKIFVFETAMRVRNIETNGGQYLTLEALAVLLEEVRTRFLYSRGIQNVNAGYQGLMVDNLQLEVISRVRVREELLFEVGIEQLSDKGGSIAIKVSRMHDGSVVAKARKHIINYDYRLNKVTTIDSSLQEKLVPSSLGI